MVRGCIREVCCVVAVVCVRMRVRTCVRMRAWVGVCVVSSMYVVIVGVCCL